MIYIEDRIKIKVGHSPEFVELSKDLLTVKEKYGWHRLGAYAGVMGNTISVADRNIIEFWRLPNFDALSALKATPEFLALSESMNACLSAEQRTLFEAFPVKGQLVNSDEEFHAPYNGLYQHASLQLRRGSREQFRELISTCVPIFGKAGWELLGSYSSLTGPNDSIIDFWRIPDANAIERALHDPALMPLLPKIHANIMDETFTLLTRLGG